VFDELSPPMPMPEPIACEGIDPGLIDPLEDVARDDMTEVDVPDGGAALPGEGGPAEAGDGELPPGDAVVLPMPVATDPIDPEPNSVAIEEGSDIIAVEPGFEVEPFTPRQVRQRDAEVVAMTDGFAAAGVDHEVFGESPWVSLTFDIANPDAVRVIADILAARS